MSRDQRDSLWFLFMQVAQRGVQRGAEVIRAHGITPPQYLVMKHLQEDSTLTQQRLAEALFVTKGNISQILKIMERDGLVHREPASDGSNQLSLTATAAAALAAVDSDHRQFTNAFFGGLSEAEIELFAQLLHKLLDSNSWLVARKEPLGDTPEDR